MGRERRLAGEDPARLKRATDTLVAGGVRDRQGAELAGDVDRALTPGEGRQFGFTVGGGFLALTGLAAWHGHEALAWGTGMLGALLVVLALTCPSRLGPVRKRWMVVARAISRVTTPIVMGLVYYVVLTPTGTLRRTLGNDPLEKKARDGSYWVVRGEARSPEHMKRQF